MNQGGQNQGGEFGQNQGGNLGQNQGGQMHARTMQQTNMQFEAPRGQAPNWQRNTNQSNANGPPRGWQQQQHPAQQQARPPQQFQPRGQPRGQPSHMNRQPPPQQQQHPQQQHPQHPPHHPPSQHQQQPRPPPSHTSHPPPPSRQSAAPGGVRSPRSNPNNPNPNNVPPPNPPRTIPSSHATSNFNNMTALPPNPAPKIDAPSVSASKIPPPTIVAPKICATKPKGDTPTAPTPIAPGAGAATTIEKTTSPRGSPRGTPNATSAAAVGSPTSLHTIPLSFPLTKTITTTVASAPPPAPAPKPKKPTTMMIPEHLQQHNKHKNLPPAPFPIQTSEPERMTSALSLLTRLTSCATLSKSPILAALNQLDATIKCSRRDKERVIAVMRQKRKIKEKESQPVVVKERRDCELEKAIVRVEQQRLALIAELHRELDLLPTPTHPEDKKDYPPHYIKVMDGSVALLTLVEKITLINRKAAAASNESSLGALPKEDTVLNGIDKLPEGFANNALDWGLACRAVTGPSSALYSEPKKSPVFKSTADDYLELRVEVSKVVKNKQRKLFRRWEELATEYVDKQGKYEVKRTTEEAKQKALADLRNPVNTNPYSKGRPNRRSSAGDTEPQGGAPSSVVSDFASSEYEQEQIIKQLVAKEAMQVSHARTWGGAF